MSTIQATNLKNALSTNNNAVMSASGDLTNAAGISYMGGSKNLLINGAMQVHQRSTSVAGITAGNYYTADRWTSYISTAGTWTNSVENDAPTGSGFQKSYKWLCTSANASLSGNSEASTFQLLEGQDLQRIAKGTSSAQQLTLSFWVKSNVTGTYVIELKDENNARHVCATYSITQSATWQKKVITFPSDIIGAFTNNNATSFNTQFWLVAGSNFTSGTLPTSWASSVTANRAVGQTNLAAATNNYWQITGTQLEIGPVATSFEFEPYETTLRKCQRYYWREVRTAGGQGDLLGGNSGNAVTAAIVDFPIRHPVDMRVGPTSVSITNLGAYGWRLGTLYSTGTFGLVFPTERSSVIRYTHGSNVFTINDFSTLVSVASGSMSIALNSEL